VLVDKLLAIADRSPERTAVVDPTRELSFANLVRFADVMRRQVVAQTRRPNVGIMLPSTVAFAGTFFGALWAGRTAIPLNFLLQPAELAKVIEDADIDVVFTIRHFQSMLSGMPVRAIFLEDLPLKREMVLERLRFKPAAPAVNADDIAVILYTSGTSGLPKGVCLSHGNLAHDAVACVRHARLTGEHRFLGILPLFHTFGLTAMLLVPVELGATVYYQPRFQLTAVVEEIRSRRISVMMAVASMYTALLRLKEPSADDWASVEYAISGGEALSPVTYDGFRQRFGRTLVQGYGLTETSPVVSIDLPWSHRAGTVGRPIPGVEVTAHDDAGRPLPSGETGELWVRGPTVMRGYYKKPTETAAVMTPDGWFKTGDMGTVDADGYVSITGRKKELIIVGGENVYPREIENVLDEHPAVVESAVIGAGDGSRGEQIVAFVLLRDGASATDIELREFCRGRLANYKVPRRVIIRPDLPRGPTGKLMKRRLSEFL